MKKIVLTVALLALAFTTGFTCSKNAPQATPEATTDQGQMAVPATETNPTVPATDAEALGAPASGMPTSH